MTDQEKGALILIALIAGLIGVYVLFRLLGWFLNRVFDLVSWLLDLLARGTSYVFRRLHDLWSYRPLDEVRTKPGYKISVVGGSLNKVSLKIERTSQEPLKIFLPTGYVFKAAEGSLLQNMVLYEDLRVDLENSRVTTLTAPVMCSNMNLEIPREYNTLQFGGIEACSRELLRLLRHIQKTKRHIIDTYISMIKATNKMLTPMESKFRENYFASSQEQVSNLAQAQLENITQTAVWIVTDNADRGILKSKIVTQTGEYCIGDVTVDAAKQVVCESKLDTRPYRIFMEQCN